MKKLLYLLSFLILPLQGQVLKSNEWFKIDKVQHITYSALFYSLGTEFAKDLKFKRPELAGAAFSISLGLAKEWINDTNASVYDLTANLVGVAVGYYINTYLLNPSPKKHKTKRLKLS